MQDSEFMLVLVTLLAVVVALLVVLVAGLLRSHAEILRELYELGVDLDPDAPTGRAQPSSDRGATTIPRPRESSRPASDVAGLTPEGDAASVAIVGVQHPTLLAFLTSGCTTCVGFWSAFADPEGVRVPGDARLVVVTKGAEAESPSRLRKFTTPGLVVVMSSDAWTAYDVPVAPYFVYLDGPSGRIVGEGAAGTWEQLTGMMEQAVADAGFSTGGRRRRRHPGSARSRELRVDRDLLAAGLEPGHPSLSPRTFDELHDPGTASDER